MWCFVNENSVKYNDDNFYLITDILDDVPEIFLKNELLKNRYKFTENDNIKVGLYISDNGTIEDIDDMENANNKE